jgi:uncharacterized protein
MDSRSLHDRPPRRHQSVLISVVFVFVLALVAAVPACAAGADDAGGMPWWGWVAALFAFSFVLGTVGVVAGVGGGVLFVPIVGSFFPFHLDFVRGTGLMIALAGSMSATPGLLRRGIADLKLALPVALISAAASIAGAAAGLSMPQARIETALGITILVVVVIMAVLGRSDSTAPGATDPLGRILRLGGVYHEPSLGREVAWSARNTLPTLLLFIGVGFVAGMFGLGAAWASVPALNLVLGAPLKLAVATSSCVLSLAGGAAVWVYIREGAMMPLIAVPSVVGMMLGTRIGTRLLLRLDSRIVRRVVLVFLLAAGLRSLLKGLGVWK